MLCSDSMPYFAVAEAALEGRPDGAEGGPEERVAQQAAQDDFLDSITQTEGPLAVYKQNRLSGRYRRVSTPHSRNLGSVKHMSIAVLHACGGHWPSALQQCEHDVAMRYSVQSQASLR